MRTSRIGIIGLWLISALSASGQGITFSQALEKVLRQNYGISLSRNVQRVAENDNTVGNAGFLPTLDLEGEQNFGSSNTDITFFDGSTINRDGARSQNLNVALALNWTVFDGFRMWARKKELEAGEELAYYNLRSQIEVTILDLAGVYYQLLFEQELLPVLKENLRISKERQKIIDNALSLGSASGLDARQAALDASNDSISLLEQQNRIRNLKEDLLYILNEPGDQLTINDELAVDTTLRLADLRDSLQQMNSALLLARSQVKIQDALVSQARSNFYPEVSLFGNLEYNFSQNEAGQVQQLSRFGPTFGVRVRFNLFNGFNDLRNLQNEQLGLANAEIQQKDAQQQAERNLNKAYNNYDYQLRILSLRESNERQATKIVETGLKQLEAGAISSVDFRTIQLELLRARSERYNASFNARLAELQLQIISGRFRVQLQ